MNELKKEDTKMNVDDAIRELSRQDFLDKLYGFAYKRCYSAHEAEDLCADIIVALLSSLQRGQEIGNFHAFVWAVARRVYADYCKNCSRSRTQILSSPEQMDQMRENPVAAFQEREEDAAQLRCILREISFLSKIYRDVMVMYYLDGKKTADIAAALHISENTVKQRLFSARSIVKKEVDKMETNYTLKPIKLDFIGSGNPVGNDPAEKAERALSQNVVYLCKNKALSAKEISEKLGVPMPFVEEELAIQCAGTNGSYGLLRRLDNSKVIANILILDVREYEEATAAYLDVLEDYTDRMERYLQKNRERILSFPFLNPQTDVRFITWSLISRMSWALSGSVEAYLREKEFPEIKESSRPFTSAAVAIRCDETLHTEFYGCNGISGDNICGYSQVTFINIQGERIFQHWGCGHNISTDPLLMMTLRAIGGLDTASLTEGERETAAKAIACGYLKREGERLMPKILVIPQEEEQQFHRLSDDFQPENADLAEKIARKLAVLIRRTVPAHLMEDYRWYNMLAESRLIYHSVEAAIAKGLLEVPEQSPCAEGAWVVVQN